MNSAMIVTVGAIVLQLVLLTCIWLVFHSIHLKRGGTSAANLFQPVAWFVLWFCLSFLVTQVILPFHDYRVLGLETLPTDRIVSLTHAAQLQLIFFLFAFLLGSTVAGSLLRRRECNVTSPLKALGRQTSNMSFLFILLGLVGWAQLYLAFAGSMRSELVGDLQGQLMYALTFVLSSGVLVFVVTEWRRKRLLLSTGTLMLCSYLMFLLGGRGRVLWPLLQIYLFYLIGGNRKVPIKKLVPVLILLFFVLQALDPLFLFVRGDVQLQEALARYSASLDVSQLFMQRTFDGFHNLTVIVGLDLIPHDLGYLLDNSGRAFMSTYFPQVEGVGFPATLLGELWMSAGTLGVCLGGAVFGYLNMFLSNLFVSIRTESALALYLVFIPWFSNIGNGWFDQHNKVIAALIPMIFLLAVDRWGGVADRVVARTGGGPLSRDGSPRGPDGVPLRSRAGPLGSLAAPQRPPRALTPADSAPRVTQLSGRPAGSVTPRV